jgi:hypothetical protein
MPTLDDELRERLRRAAPLPPGADDLGEQIAHRRRRRAAQRTASRVALVTLVLVGTIAGVTLLDRAFRGGQPAVSQPPAPTPTLGEDGTLSLEGVPFRVCRPMSIPGDFGAGVDTLWVFEEEVEPDAGCERQGAVHVAVGSANSVSVLSGRLNDQLESLLDSAAPWPYAAFDIDGDQFDESLAIGIGGSRDDGYARIILFRLAPGGTEGAPGEVRRVSFSCGSRCVPGPWINLGTFVESLAGAYCDTPSTTGQPGLVRWSAGEGVVEGTAWYLEGDILREGEQVFSRTDDGTYPADGTTDLCGSPASWPEDFPTYPDAASLTPELPGVDVGHGERLCEPSTIDGEFDGDPGTETVWVGAYVRGDRCGDPFLYSVAMIDLDADGAADGVRSLPRCTQCASFAAIDFDADGVDELVILLQGGTTPEYAVYESSRWDSERSPGLYPLFVHPGAPSTGFPEGSALTFNAGGDEGSSFAVECEGFPEAPVLVLWSGEHPVDAPGSDVTAIRMTKLRLSDGAFAAIASDSYEQPTTDPLPFDGRAAACGVEWTL